MKETINHTTVIDGVNTVLTLEIDYHIEESLGGSYCSNVDVLTVEYLNSDIFSPAFIESLENEVLAEMERENKELNK